jgi:1-deoxy-D-xylulose-5-phosphate reductoisomerase
MRRRLTILGSTGSIGRQALDVVSRYPERFEIVGLSAGNDARALALQAAEFRPEYVALESSEAGPLEDLASEVFAGPGSAEQLSTG